MKTKLTNKNKQAGIGILALGLLGGLGALVIGIGLGLVVYKIVSIVRPPPAPAALVTNINGQAQSPFTVGNSN